MAKKKKASLSSKLSMRRLPLSGAALAAKYADEGKSMQAISWANGALNRRSSFEDLMTAAQIYFRFDKFAETLKCLDAASELETDSSISLYHRICSLAALGQAELAISLFENTPRGTGAPDALQLAHYLEKGGDIASAVNILRTAAQTPDASGDVPIEQARLMGKCQQYPEAHELLIHTLDNFPLTELQRAKAWFYIGVHLENVEAELSEIERAYRNCIQHAPQYLSPYINLGLLLNRNNRFMETIELLSPVIELVADNVKIVYLLAVAHRMADQVEPAFALLQSLVDTTNYDPAWELYGRYLTELGRDEAAVNHYRRWLSVEPGNSVAVHMLAASQGTKVPLRASPTYVSETFDGFADTFEATLQRLKYRGPQFIQQLLISSLGEPVSPPTRRMLDAGCGTGLMGLIMREYGSELIGVDLSQGMLERAAEKGVYDQLLCADLEKHLRDNKARYDLIVAADTFNYFGDLSELLSNALSALTDEGWLMFSLEEGPLTGETYQLQPHGRFAHSPAYIIERMGECGLSGGNMRRVVMRQENGQDVHALLIAIQKPAVPADV